MEKIDKSIFFNYNRVLSFGCLLNFLIGSRGVGKTYGISEFVTNQFLKKQEEFAYIRRYRNELNEGISEFFTAINKNDVFPEHRLYTKNKKFYCDDIAFGRGVTLSTSQDLKRF